MEKDTISIRSWGPPPTFNNISSGSTWMSPFYLSQGPRNLTILVIFRLLLNTMSIYV